MNTLQTVTIHALIGGCFGWVTFQAIRISTLEARIKLLEGKLELLQYYTKKIWQGDKDA